MGLGPLGILTGEHGPAVSAVKPIMSVNADNLSAAVRYALETTRAIAVCPFHCDVIIRFGDDAAETHAFVRATRIVKSNGKTWKGEALRKEFRRQLSKAADRYCPHCAGLGDPEL
jgi:hypothetical protein